MSELTISQGLRAVARLKGKIADAKARVSLSINHREDQKPAFPFDVSMSRLGEYKSELVKLEAMIAVTNASTRVEFGGRQVTLSEGLKRLQEYKDDLAWLRGLHCQAQSTGFVMEPVLLPDGEYRQQRVITVCHLTEQQRSDLVENIQASFDSLNDLIEKKNHETVLLAL